MEVAANDLATTVSTVLGPPSPNDMAPKELRAQPACRVAGRRTRSAAARWRREPIAPQLVSGARRNRNGTADWRLQDIARWPE